MLTNRHRRYRVASTFSALAFVITAALPTVGVTAEYEIDIKLTTSAAYSAMDVNVSYAATGGQIVGSAGDAECTVNSALNAVAAFNDCETTSQLGCTSGKQIKSAVMAVVAFTGPKVLFTCVYSGTSAPSAAQFVVTVEDWTATHSTQPSVSVSRIEQIP
jgi:hypothetical protein